MPLPLFVVSTFNISETIQGYSYCGMPTGTRMQFIEWCSFKSPWMTRTRVSRARHYSTLNVSENETDAWLLQTIENDMAYCHRQWP